MTTAPASASSGRLMPRWWKVLFLTGVLFLAIGLVATLWVEESGGPVPISGLESESVSD